MRSGQKQSSLVFVFSFITFVTAIFSPLACEPGYIFIGPKSSTWTPNEKSEVCVDVSEEQLFKVLDAIYAWDVALNNWKRLVPRLGKNFEGCDYTISEAEPTDEVGPLTLAMTSSLFGREIKLYKGRYEIDPTSIVLHELGHAFGAKHMPGTMMNAEIIYFKYKCPDAATIAQIATANGLSPDVLAWCKQ